MKKYYKFLALVPTAILPVASLIACGKGKDKDKETVKDLDKDKDKKEIDDKDLDKEKDKKEIDDKDLDKEKDKKEIDDKDLDKDKDNVKDIEILLMKSLIKDILSKKITSNLENKNHVFPSEIVQNIIDKTDNTDQIFEKIGINIDKIITKYINIDKLISNDEEGKIIIEISFKKFSLVNQKIVVEGFDSKIKLDPNDILAVEKIFNFFQDPVIKNITAVSKTNTYEFFKEKSDNHQSIDMLYLPLPHHQILKMINEDNVTLNFEVDDIGKNNAENFQLVSQHQGWVRIKVTITKNQIAKETIFEINNLSFQSQRDVDYMSIFFKNKMDIENVANKVGKHFNKLKNYDKISPSDFIKMKVKEISKKSKNFTEHDVDSLEIPEFWYDMFEYALFDISNMYLNVKGDYFANSALNDFIVRIRGKVILKNFQADDINGKITFEVAISKRTSIGNFWNKKTITIEGFKKTS